MINTVLIKSGSIEFLSTDENGNCRVVGCYPVTLTQNNIEVIQAWIDGEEWTSEELQQELN